MRIEEDELSVALKLNKLMLNEDENLKVLNWMKDKVAKNNVLTIYSLAKLYKLANFSDSSLLYIERCFQIVVETQNFLHLDFNLVVKILSSSELNIHSEVEVFNSAIAWLKHNIEERSKYSKQLLSKVRITLLSEHALECISNCYSIFSKNQEFYKIFKEVYTNCLRNKTSSFITNRYCGQDMFNILICGGQNSKSYEVVSTVNQIKGIDLNKTKTLSSMTIEREMFTAVCLKGEIYVFGGYDNVNNLVKSIERYSLSTNKWSKVTSMYDNRVDFCACSFMDKIYVFGGCFYNNEDDYYTSINSCLQFDTKKESWKTIARLKKARGNAACVVFNGNIVISGGMENDNIVLNTVESYDVFGDKLTSMPSMIYSHKFHNLVVVKNKLFVISKGIESCEVYDNACKKFVVLKHQPYIYCNKSVSIGKKIMIFQEAMSTVICYDVDKDEWSEESCEVTKDLIDFSCTKLPWY